MTKHTHATPAADEQRDFIFAPAGGESVTVTATYQKTWRGDLDPCIGVDDVCAILDAWTLADQGRRRSLSPTTERSDDDVFIAYTRNGQITLGSWSVATDRDTYSLEALPGLLPRDHYRLTEAPPEES